MRNLKVIQPWGKTGWNIILLLIEPVLRSTVLAV